MTMTIDFYLKLEEPSPTRRVWTCAEVQRVFLENQRECLVVDASLYDPAPDPASFRSGEDLQLESLWRNRKWT